MKIGLTKITFKDEEDKRYNLMKAYKIIESNYKRASITYCDKGLTVEYTVNKGIYK